jgi:formate dehydrogenase gamma subunit
MKSQTILRHRAVDRALHWLFALTVLTLLITGLFPYFGVNLPWVTVHWVAGVLLLALLLLHLIQVLLKPRASRRAMNVGMQDVQILKASLETTGDSAAKPGKYSLAQKILHLGVAKLVVIAIITGALMMVKIDTPLWERNPYWLQPSTWGIIYVLHGLVALGFVTTIVVHIYFSLRPEKRLYLRSMLSGRITREEFIQHHNPDLWQGHESEKSKNSESAP